MPSDPQEAAKGRRPDREKHPVRVRRPDQGKHRAREKRLGREKPPVQEKLPVSNGRADEIILRGLRSSHHRVLSSS